MVLKGYNTNYKGGRNRKIIVVFAILHFIWFKFWPYFDVFNAKVVTIYYVMR